MRSHCALVDIDPWLKPYAANLERRYRHAVLTGLLLTNGEQTLGEWANYHLYYGLHHDANGWVFREKAPHARRVFLYGDFSSWQIEDCYALTPLGNGDWELHLPFHALKHGMLYKMWIIWDGGSDERLPSCCTRVVQDPDTRIFSAQVWFPEQPYAWKHPNPPRPAFHYIYEAHPGIASDQPLVATYQYFRKMILPRIHQLGYNTLQLMAVQEHPYYGSFGYQVSNFFAPSSRFGTPEDLKCLIDEAHGLGIAVWLDLVHSHAVSNAREGIAYLDGSDSLYCYAGKQGQHPVWNSRCFNYGKPETLAFLLSNIKYWLHEFRFDGFRFDGVTSMCYRDHGIGVNFTDYKQYFDARNVDNDAIAYLTLANQLVKELNPTAVSVAEDMSGLPGLAFPVSLGGIGFDYRMAMGIPDYWGKLIKEYPDETWSPGDIYFHLTDTRPEEQTISYAESHDQALVGDKTFIFRMIDKEMYDKMSIDIPSLPVDRGMSLHKIIRFLTLTLARGGYLNFMGNEFGHPEWIDFPREGNQWSYSHALRRWDLADNPHLKYRYLKNFDQALLQATQQVCLSRTLPKLLCAHEHDKVLAFERAGGVFVVNLNPTYSFTDYEIPASQGIYDLLLNSDAPEFGGFSRLATGQEFHSYKRQDNDYLKLYLPTRTALLLFSK
ncbi:MAG: alpha amylase C-terminal domain-containing protein [Bacteroidales bacterium]|jgi:1,4-alpha-glucan branching enzyme|nr:alpha amylase C-terminal domain-containing protein [Bacteroidales bacterium]